VKPVVIVDAQGKSPFWIYARDTLREVGLANDASRPQGKFKRYDRDPEQESGTLEDWLRSIGPAPEPSEDIGV
jgi:hypothetical protein